VWREVRVSPEEQPWSGVSRCPPCFCQWALLNSANDRKIVEMICFILCTIIVRNRNAALCFNDKLMLLIEPS